MRNVAVGLTDGEGGFLGGCSYLTGAGKIVGGFLPTTGPATVFLDDWALHENSFRLFT